MDALGGVYSYLEKIRQDYVVLAGGDVAVNLPLGEIFEEHLRCGADITAVCTPVPRGDPRNSDYFTVDADGWVTDVAVQPVYPAGLESMEVYIMSKALLMSLVEHCTAHNIPSFSQGVLLSMADKLKIRAYSYSGYAARLQSVSGYYARSMELLDPVVRAQLFDPARPIKTKDRSDPSTYYGPDAKSIHSLVADGCLIEGEVENSIVSRHVVIEKGAKVSNCVLMQGTVVKSGASLSYVITDKDVTVNQDRMLMGHLTYPLAIAKGSVV